MGRKSLDATKLLCRLIVRAAVDFFRGAWPFLAVDFFALPDVDEVELFFFLAGEEPVVCELLEAEEGVWAGNPLPCNSNNTAILNAVKRLKNIGRFSLPRLAAPACA
jgi:hypothetical protein